MTHTKCVNCDGDGWVEIMDLHHYGAVIGGQPCPACDGEGYTDELEGENAELLAEYEAWATGELSEISDEAMLAGSPKYQAVVNAMIANGEAEGDAFEELRKAYRRVTGGPD